LADRTDGGHERFYQQRSCNGRSDLQVFLPAVAYSGHAASCIFMYSSIPARLAADGEILYPAAIAREAPDYAIQQT
jgi:hypothetical protein